MNDYDLLKDDVYSIRTEGESFRITKFTKDLNPVGFYKLVEKDGGFTCNCPQSNRGACKHLDVVDAFMTYPERIDKGWFFCQQTGDWFPPVTENYGRGPMDVAHDIIHETDPNLIETMKNDMIKHAASLEASGAVAPPPPGGGEADLDPSTASPITPEVEAPPPPSRPPSGVMTFSEPLKRRI